MEMVKRNLLSSLFYPPYETGKSCTRATTKIGCPQSVEMNAAIVIGVAVCMVIVSIGSIVLTTLAVLEVNSQGLYP